MIELEVYGFVWHPGNTLRECIDAAGIDASMRKCNQTGADADIAASDATGGVPWH